MFVFRWGSCGPAVATLATEHAWRPPGIRMAAAHRRDCRRKLPRAQAAGFFMLVVSCFSLIFSAVALASVQACVANVLEFSLRGDGKFLFIDVLDNHTFPFVRARFVTLVVLLHFGQVAHKMNRCLFQVAWVVDGRCGCKSKSTRPAAPTSEPNLYQWGARGA